MYLEHFNLAQMPFAITPNTAFVYGSRAHREALNTLLLALDGGEGFIKITGEVGTGKTLACRKLLALLAEKPEKYATAYVPNPCLSPRTLFLSIALELKLPIQPDASEHNLLSALNQGLIKYALEDRKVVVCLDETQAMPVGTLEALRLLSNLETEQSKLMHVVLFGQPELDDKLARDDLRQLTQRISFQYELKALDFDETERYLAHRLRVAGYRGEALFPSKTVKLILRTTRGVPRLINIVAHKALLLAYGEGALRVAPRHVRAAAADTPHASGAGWLADLLARLTGWRQQRRVGANA